LLQAFGPDIWITDGPVIRAAAGFHYPTRMVVMRLADGALVLWSPIALSAQLRAEVETVGKVRHLVAPNTLHHTFLAEWHQGFPDAMVHAPPGLRQKRTDIAFDADLSDGPVAAWAGEIDHAIMWGNRITQEAVFFHRKSATVIFADLIQQFSPGWFTGWRALVARLDLMTAPQPCVPRKFRLAFTDRPAARNALRPILAWPAENVIIAHGPPILGDGQAFLQRAFGWLTEGEMRCLLARLLRRGRNRGIWHG
jgi:hypothetical protein